MSDTKQLKEKVVLITGASSGIGSECALEFAREGSFLALTGRNMEALGDVKQKCLELGTPEDKILVIHAELSKESDTDKVIDDTVQHFGRIDILINNAGLIIPGSMEASTMADYDHTMNVNTRAVFLLTKLALPHLIPHKGNIVNISSITGSCSFPNVMGYCMSKAAINQMTKCLALEMAPKGVRVNAVCPGVIKTQVHKRGGMNDEAYEKFLEHSKTTHALGRHGEAQEVSRVVTFLASNHASFITGSTMPIDGGRGIMCPR